MTYMQIYIHSSQYWWDQVERQKQRNSIKSVTIGLSLLPWTSILKIDSFSWSSFSIVKLSSSFWLSKLKIHLFFIHYASYSCLRIWSSISFSILIVYLLSILITLCFELGIWVNLGSMKWLKGRGTAISLNFCYFSLKY